MRRSTAAADPELTGGLPAMRDALPPEIARANKSSTEESSGWQALALCSTTAARRYLHSELALKLSALPLGVHSIGESLFLTVAVDDEIGPEALKELRFACGVELVLERVPGAWVQRAVRAAYFAQSDQIASAARVALDAARQSSRGASAKDRARPSAPVPVLFDRIVDRAVFLRASDVHIESQFDRVRIRYRVYGVLQEDQNVAIDATVAPALFRRIKVLANLDTTSIGSPQDGSFSREVSETVFRVRVSFVPQLYGEKAVLRILDNAQWDARGEGTGVLAEMGLTDAQSTQLLSQLVYDRGVILVAGPTGSGKSTLLYGLLGILNAPQSNLVTLEDPVERLIPGTTQIQVEGFSGAGFRGLLRAALRQDPNVLMVGEIRDAETAETALTAGLTGMQVLSTVHAGNCIDAITRMLQLGTSIELLSSALRLIVSQRLVARNCPRCAETVPAPKKVVELFKLSIDTVVRASPGCGACSLGQQGRTGVFELLPLTEELRTELRNERVRLDRQAMQKLAYESGYRPLAFAVREALLAGIIPPEAAIRALGFNPQVFRAL